MTFRRRLRIFFSRSIVSTSQKSHFGFFQVCRQSLGLEKTDAIVPHSERERKKKSALEKFKFCSAQVCTDRRLKKTNEELGPAARERLIRLAQNSECLSLADWLGSIRDGSFFFRESDSVTRCCGGELDLEVKLKLERVGGLKKKPVDTKAEKPPLYIFCVITPTSSISSCAL